MNGSTFRRSNVSIYSSSVKPASLARIVALRPNNGWPGRDNAWPIRIILSIYLGLSEYDASDEFRSLPARVENHLHLELAYGAVQLDGSLLLDKLADYQPADL